MDHTHSLLPFSLFLTADISSLFFFFNFFSTSPSSKKEGKKSISFFYLFIQKRAHTHTFEFDTYSGKILRCYSASLILILFSFLLFHSTSFRLYKTIYYILCVRCTHRSILVCLCILAANALNKIYNANHLLQYFDFLSPSLSLSYIYVLCMYTQTKNHCVIHTFCRHKWIVMGG